MTTLSIAQTATLAHGFTMADVENLTWASIKHAWGSGSLDHSDRWETAWHAIVERLYDHDKPTPTSKDLLTAGGNAITYARNDQFREHGINVNTAERAPSFLKFWNNTKPVHDGFSDRVVERLALRQVLALLTSEQYEALVAFSIYENYRDAASSLRIETYTLNARLQAARTVIKAVWFAPETPRQPIKKNDPTQCLSGHPRSQFGRINNQGKWHCSRCARDRSRRQQARAGGYGAHASAKTLGLELDAELAAAN